MAESIVNHLLNRKNVQRVKSESLKGSLHKIIWIMQNGMGAKLYNKSPPQHSELLNLGCGLHVYSGWINADCYNFFAIYKGLHRRPDWLLDATKAWNCKTSHWQGVFCEHMIEHLAYPEAIFVFREIFRTLKPEGWLRVVVPDLETYVRYYQGEVPAPEFDQFAHGALALSNLAQNWGHVSLWNASLLTAVLREIGFSDVSEVAFNKGSDEKLIKDSANRAWESLYVEGRKPSGLLK